MHVPVVFQTLGRRAVPTIEFHVRVAGQSARLSEFAMIDTGSAFTILSRRLLQVTRFDLHNAKALRGGIHGVGGQTDAYYLENATISLVDQESRIHQVNLPRLFFTDAKIPPLFGREALSAFNSTLLIDFTTKTGTVRIG